MNENEKYEISKANEEFISKLSGAVRRNREKELIGSMVAEKVSNTKFSDVSANPGGTGSEGRKIFSFQSKLMKYSAVASLVIAVSLSMILYYNNSPYFNTSENNAPVEDRIMAEAKKTVADDIEKKEVEPLDILEDEAAEEEKEPEAIAGLSEEETTAIETDGAFSSDSDDEAPAKPRLRHNTRKNATPPAPTIVAQPETPIASNTVINQGMGGSSRNEQTRSAISVQSERNKQQFLNQFKNEGSKLNVGQSNVQIKPNADFNTDITQADQNTSYKKRKDKSSPLATQDKKINSADTISELEESTLANSAVEPTESKQLSSYTLNVNANGKTVSEIANIVVDVLNKSGLDAYPLSFSPTEYRRIVTSNKNLYSQTLKKNAIFLVEVKVFRDPIGKIEFILTYKETPGTIQTTGKSPDIENLFNKKIKDAVKKKF